MITMPALTKPTSPARVWSKDKGWWHGANFWVFCAEEYSLFSGHALCMGSGLGRSEKTRAHSGMTFPSGDSFCVTPVIYESFVHTNAGSAVHHESLTEMALSGWFRKWKNLNGGAI